VKAILRTWAGLELEALDEREVLRGFLQRLLRLSPFVAFDALEPAVLDAELRVVALETIDAVGTVKDARTTRAGTSRG
jgi:hypothetical protein